MKLDRIHVQGFKSFRDRTTIAFNEGITGIVGPNGCGKSNIVDALFWVMGEQSAKHLRGDKMSDLIFSGTTKYHAASFAEVTLVLHNTNLKHIHINNKVLQPSQIELTRKLYRDGETEYRINGIPARLKDIQEVFMDTGAGAKSYSIIAQGEIDRLVKAKPEDRRSMIDEVAGITKFKVRRKESLRKIELTQTNLARIQDLKKEIHKYLQSLSEQAAKATKARNLQDKINKTEMSFLYNKEFDYLEKIANAQEKLNDAEISLAELSAQYSEVDLKLQELKNSKVEKIEKVDAFQLQYNEQAKDLVKMEERSKSLRDLIKQGQFQIEQLTRDLTDLRSDEESRGNVLSEVKKHLEELENLDPDSIDESSWNERLQVLDENYQTLMDDVNSLQTEKLEASQAEQKLNQQKEINQHKLDDVFRQLQETSEEMDQLENTYSLFNEESEQKRDALKEQEQQLAKTEEELEKNEADWKKSSQKLENLKQTVMTNKANASRIKNQIQSFSKILENKTKTVVKLDEKWSPVLFSELFDIKDKKFATCIQSYFQNYMTTYFITEGESEHFGLEDWMNSKSNVVAAIGAQTTSTEVVKNKIQELVGSNTVYSGSQLVAFKNSQWSQKFSSTLDGLFFIDEISSKDFFALPWKEIAQKLNDHQFSEIHFASESSPVGITIKNGTMAIMAASQGAQEDGVIVLKKQLQDWNEELAALSEVLKREESELLEFLELEKSEKSKITQLEQTKLSLIKSLSGHSAEIQAKQAGHQNAMARLEILKRKKSDCSLNRLTYLEHDETIESELEKLRDESEDLDTRLSEAKNLANQSLNKLNSVKSEYQSLMAKGQGREQQMVRLKAQILDIENQIQKISERIDRNKLTHTQANDLIIERTNEVEQLEATLKEKQVEQSEFFKFLQEEKENLAKHLLEIDEQEKSFKHYVSKKQQFERVIDEQSAKLPQWKEDELLLARDWSERFGFDIRLLVQHQWSESRFPENLLTLELSEKTFGDKIWEIKYPEFEWSRKAPAQIKDLQDRLRRYNYELNALGAINWQAIEEYDKQKIRHDFLDTQEQELTKSIEDLMTAISQIDEKSKLRFKAAFESINDKFSKVFPIIFGGGFARLQLTTTTDDPECGVEIIAQPPGKKMQSINLMSGGEKAMTAVSLIFSIFLVKPSPFCLLDEVDAPLDDANVGRFNELLREMSNESQFILITHNKKTMELNDTLYGITMQEPGVSQAVSVQLH
ncbi:MAG: chromosome segregation protein SMC [Bacteriovoracaceae bacterium]|nr:chromosome segregation protein SMC [Bacteriovoracaceae bacterium]